MNFGLSQTAFLNQHFALKKLSGSEKFLALSAILSKGVSVELTPSQIKKAWAKTVMKISYNPSQYHRAQSDGWVETTGKGTFVVTSDGYAHLEDIQLPQSGSSTGNSTRLDIFSIGKTHSFDKFLRTIFSGATKTVMIADSYVDETVFDNLLDQIPEAVTISLLYGNKQGTFDARVKRFKKQYSHFTAKSHSSLHDRFFVIDDVGYIIGPSLKDAARKSPATVVSLGQSDTKKIKQFFASFWAQAK